MKTQFVIFTIVLISVGILFSSFSVDKNSKWKKLKTPKSFSYIPTGILHAGTEKEVSINGFYISKTEISNQDYNNFLKDLLKQGRQDALKRARRKTENWKPKPFQEIYHLHPSYADYPALTVSKEGAEMYCQWLAQKIQTKNPKFEIEVRLPTEQEWIYAAHGGHQYAPYPWGGYYVRNNKGCFLANFKNIDSRNISYDRKNNTYEVKDSSANRIGVNNIITMPQPVKSYFPNNYGLYNMSGNAAEMLSTNSTKEEGGFRTKGGCYDSLGLNIQINGPDEFDGWTEPSQYIGFRPVMSVRLK